ncbi:MAG: hypothetical protein C4296_02580 [Gemmataceae bacterium]
MFERWLSVCLDRLDALVCFLQWTVLRWSVLLLGKTLYRVHVLRTGDSIGGPAVLVCNPVFWLEAVFLAAALRRPVRIIVWRTRQMTAVETRLASYLGAVAIEVERGQEGIERALQEMVRCLGRGECLCLLSECAYAVGKGVLCDLSWVRLLEGLRQQVRVPIVPVALDRGWGRVLIRRRCGRRRRLQWCAPVHWPGEITIALGQPEAHDTPAYRIQLSVQKLLADCLQARQRRRLPAHRLFVRMACRHPGWPCLYETVPQPRALTYGQALAGAILLARKLGPRLGNQQMVGVLLPTTAAGVLVNMALALLRRTAVNLNYTASREAFESAIRQADVQTVLSARTFSRKLPVQVPDNVRTWYIEDVREEIGALERVTTYLAVRLLPVWVVERVWLRLGSHSAEDLAAIVFSSGSTGDPKGIELTHDNIVSNMESMAQAVYFTPRDRMLAVLPFFHSFGYTVTLWLPAVVGASAVYYPDPRQAREIGDLARTYRCTLFVTTPTFLRLIHRRCEPQDFRSLRLLITGAEKLPGALAQQFAEKFGIYPLEGYGCTELSPVVAVNTPDRVEDGLRYIGHKPGSIGRPVPGVACRIVEPESPDPERPLPAGSQGLLIVYGANVMRGYLRRPEETRRAILHGWYLTGDLATMDEDGFVRITDRMSRFSKIGGEMVPHQRIEHEIHRLLGTEELVCAVTAIPDDRKGERLVVLHKPLDGLSVHELYHRLARSGLPSLWLPDPDAFFEVPEIPVLGSGKLDLQRIKRLALELCATRGGGA